MTEFKIGDKVRYREDGFTPEFRGIEGEVVNSRHLTVGISFKVTKTTPEYLKIDGKKVGTVESVFAASIEHIEEKSFKIGDVVTVKGWVKDYPTTSGWEGRTGTIDRVYTGWASVQFTDVNKDSIYSNGGFNNEYLVPAKTFGFEDIQIGDKIKRTRTYADGTEESTVGVVDTKGALTAYSARSNPLAFSSDSNRETVTLELLERPEPEPEPKIWENRKKGDKVIREDEEGILTVFTKEDGDEWSSIYLNNTKPNLAPEKGYDWDKTDIGDALAEDYKLTLIEA